MNAIISFSYRPYATGVYIENAFSKEHKTHYVGPASAGRPGYNANQDLITLIADGEIDVDFFLAVDYGRDFFPRGLENLSCPTAIYLIDTHRNFALRSEYARFFDYVFVAQRDHVDRLRNLGIAQAYWLPLACDPQIHGRKKVPKTWDIGFVGQLHSPHRTHRLQLLADRYTINDYHKHYPKEDISEIYSRAKIVFNTSIDGDLNMRVFEAMASGTLLVTDRISNGQRDLFEPGVHLVEYDSDEELLEVVDYYLLHNEEREEIARTGMELVLAEHTYHRRCQQIIETVFDSGPPSLNAMVRKWDNAKRLDAYASIYYRKRAIEPLLDLFEESKNQKGIIYWRILYRAFLSFVRRASRILR